MRIFRGRWALFLIGGAALAYLLNAGIGFLALKRLEKRAGAPIHGTFLPHFFLSSFTLKNASLNWQGRFEVLSGMLKVQYDPLFLLPGRKFRVQVVGRDLAVRFSSELAESQGFSLVQVDEAEGDFALSKKGPPEIFFFDVRSPQLRFHVGKGGAGRGAAR